MTTAGDFWRVHEGETAVVLGRDVTLSLAYTNGSDRPPLTLHAGDVVRLTRDAHRDPPGWVIDHHPWRTMQGDGVRPDEAPMVREALLSAASRVLPVGAKFPVSVETEWCRLETERMREAPRREAERLEREEPSEPRGVPMFVVLFHEAEDGPGPETCDASVSVLDCSAWSDAEKAAFRESPKPSRCDVRAVAIFDSKPAHVGDAVALTTWKAHAVAAARFGFRTWIAKPVVSA